MILACCVVVAPFRRDKAVKVAMAAANTARAALERDAVAARMSTSSVQNENASTSKHFLRGSTVQVED